MDRSNQEREPRPLEKVHGHSLFIVRLIAAGKLLKALLLLVIGGFLLHSIKLDKSVHDSLRDFIFALQIDEHNRIIQPLLDKSLGVKDKLMGWLSVGTLVYSLLYGIEGIGLLWDKAWAEWLLIITTAGFIPLEIYEIVEHQTIVRDVILALNVAALVYISMRLRWRHLARLEARTLGRAVVSADTTKRGIGP